MKIIKKVLFSFLIMLAISTLCPNNAEAAAFKLAKKTVTITTGKKYEIEYKNEPDDSEYYVDYKYSTKSKYIKVSKYGIVKAKNYPGKKAKVNITADVYTWDENGQEILVNSYKFKLTVKIKARKPGDPDFESAEEFEAALNAGKNLTGKTVRFKVKELHPNSAFGYNMWAGEHLNFCSPTHPNKRAGDTATVKVTKVVSFLGSYIISYTNLK